MFISLTDDDTDVSSLNGNVTTFLADSVSGVVFYDGSADTRILHYYPAEMAATGVSRIRLATVDKLPKGSQLIGLVQLKDSSSDFQILYAVDTSGNQYDLVLCTTFEN